MPSEYTSAFCTRFWAKVQKTDECWLWLSVTDRKGYGRFWADGRYLRATAVAWHLAYGADPEAGLLLCHRCDTPSCVRPDHLFLGTAAANRLDASTKGRLAVGEQHWARRHPEWLARGANHGAQTHPERFARGDQHSSHLRPECRPRGERHPQAKLTEPQVIEIRQRYAAGGETLVSLGVRFGVSPSNIGRIVKGDNWKGIPAQADGTEKRL